MIDRDVPMTSLERDYTASPPPTHTHTAVSPRQGYRPAGRSRSSHHYADARPGRTHAATLDRYGDAVALCGVTVSAREENEYGDPITWHIQPVTAGRQVTCRRCLRLMESQ